MFGASELVITEHPGDCGPSEPGITAFFCPEHEVAAGELVVTYRTSWIQWGPSEPGITAIVYPEHEVAAIELVGTYRTSWTQRWPSEPGITAIVYPEHEVAATELAPTEHPGYSSGQASQVLPPSLILITRSLLPS
jgi:hypothetical protein